MGPGPSVKTLPPKDKRFIGRSEALRAILFPATTVSRQLMLRWTRPKPQASTKAAISQGQSRT